MLTSFNPFHCDVVLFMIEGDILLCTIVIRHDPQMINYSIKKSTFKNGGQQNSRTTGSAIRFGILRFLRQLHSTRKN